MKKILILSTLALFLTSFSVQDGLTPDEFKAVKKYLSKTTKVQHDRFEKLLWITPEKPVETNLFGATTIETYFLFNQDGTLGPKRFRFKYTASDWLFIDELSFLIGNKNSDQRVYNINFNKDDLIREVLTGTGGTIYEKIDIPFNDSIIEFYNDVLNTEKNEPVAYKISGKSTYVNTATWSGKFKKMAQPVIEAYDYLESNQYK